MTGMYLVSHLCSKSLPSSRLPHACLLPSPLQCHSGVGTKESGGPDKVCAVHRPRSPYSLCCNLLSTATHVGQTEEKTWLTYPSTEIRSSIDIMHLHVYPPFLLTPSYSPSSVVILFPSCCCCVVYRCYISFVDTLCNVRMLFVDMQDFKLILQLPLIRY